MPKRFLIWKEKKKGQLMPSRLDSASTETEAKQKAKNSKFPYVYVIDTQRSKAYSNSELYRQNKKRRRKK